MRTATIAVIVSAFVIVPLLAFGMSDDSAGDVEKVIVEGYFNGAFNDQDTMAMGKAFHPDFAIFSANGEKLGRYEIGQWIAGIEKRKDSPDYDATASKMDCKIVDLDVTGNVASAKIQCGKNGKPVYTDYLSLIKFKSGWKIVAKIYHQHK